MAVTHSGLLGLSAPRHVDRELNVALVHVPIPHQQAVDETVVDWDSLQNGKVVTHKVVQVKVLSNQFYWTIKKLMQLPLISGELPAHVTLSPKIRGNIEKRSHINRS